MNDDNQKPPSVVDAEASTKCYAEGLEPGTIMTNHTTIDISERDRLAEEYATSKTMKHVFPIEMRGKFRVDENKANDFKSGWDTAIKSIEAKNPSGSVCYGCKQRDVWLETKDKEVEALKGERDAIKFAYDSIESVCFKAQDDLDSERARSAKLVEALEALLTDKHNCGCETGNHFEPEFVCGYHKAIADYKASRGEA